MKRASLEDVAIAQAGTGDTHYGHSLFDGSFYTGTAEQLKRVGVVEPALLPAKSWIAKPKSHPEGYSVEVWRGETRLASVYGATPQEAQARAMTVAGAFEADTFDTENEEG